MKAKSSRGRVRPSRRNFLRGAAGVAVALPFLESLPERSAWGADESPVFALFICAVGGVVPAEFFPSTVGPLTRDALAAAGKATSELARHADRLLMLRGINYPGGTFGDSHIINLCMALTARPAQGSDQNATSTGPSADAVIAATVHPGLAPLTLHGGDQRNGYAAERISFASAGQLNVAINNPYTLYQGLVGLLDPGGGMTPEGEAAARRLLLSRNSIHDLVRDDLTSLMALPRLSSADRQRLQMHFDAIRDAEVGMGGMGNDIVEQCSAEGLDVDKLEALRQFRYDPNGGVEEVSKLHMSLVALAFACNYRRAATIQWGDPYDRTIYDVPANERGWRFSYIMHRAESDGTVGDDPLAATAHAQIDRVRMASLAAGLDHFAARELADRCFVMWTNNFNDGHLHSIINVPHILWGSGGSYLRQGEYLDAGGTENNRLLNTLISAAIQDTGTVVNDFGLGTPGQLDAIRA